MIPLLKYQWLSFSLMFFAFCGFTVFLYGYFPLKYHTGYIASWSDLPQDVEGQLISGKKLYVPKEHNRIVLMVIDALRYDFVTEEYMPFMAHMIKEGEACLYRAHAEPPTVTMPRIKSSHAKKGKAQWRRTVNFWRDVFAMTTGSVSNFIDVALNFGSSAITDDSFLHQAKLENKKMIFYGDDTWLRLFPDAFSRSEGTTSFYVSDFTEVDHNVTRNLVHEVDNVQNNSPDWDLMVLHYLGLDHIGHLEGPASQKVKPKMEEMDNIVKMIVQNATSWEGNTILVLCGDHGMKDSGSHGGASYNEVTVPLVITQKRGCSSKFTTDVDQIDMAPTISYLMGLPIPRSSTGQILPQVVSNGQEGDLTSHSAIYTLYYNALLNMQALIQVLGEEEALKKECYRQFNQAEKYYSQYLRDDKSRLKMIPTMFINAMNEMQKYLTKSIVEFDMFAIILGIILVSQTFIVQLLSMIITYQTKIISKYSDNYKFKQSNVLLGRVVAFIFLFAIFLLLFMMSCGITQSESSLCRWYPLSLTVVSAVVSVLLTNSVLLLNSLKHIHKKNELTKFNPVELFLVIGTVIQCLSYAGTSFIEEEHQTWYFMWVSVEFLILIYTGSILVEYCRKKREGATEIQDKGDLEQKMSNAGKWLLPQWVLLMVLHRFLRTLNQTGDKWAFLPDTADWLNEDNNKNLLSLLAVFALIFIGFICIRNLERSNDVFKINSLLTIGAIFCIFAYRVSSLSMQVPFDIPLVDEFVAVQIFWGLIFCMMIVELWSAGSYFTTNQNNTNDCVTEKNSNYSAHPASQLLSVSECEKPDIVCTKMKILVSRTNIFLNIMILVCSLLLKPHNLILVPSIYITSKIVNKVLDYQLGSSMLGIDTAKKNSPSKNVFCKTFFHIWIGAVFYFYQGNSNSLASIDLSSGYVGLQSYIPVVVALQMGIHTYTGPLLAGLFLFVDCVKINKQYDEFLIHLKECVSTISVVRIYPLVVYTIIATYLRYHLFVWTVISPKLLYDFTLLYLQLSSILTMIILCGTVTLQYKICNYLCCKQTNKSYQPKDQ